MEHRGDEPQFTAVALDPLSPVGASGAQQLLAVVGAARVTQRPGDERAGPRPLVVVPLLGTADVGVADLEPVLPEGVDELGQGGEVAGPRTERLLRGSGRVPLPDGVAEQGTPPGRRCRRSASSVPCSPPNAWLAPTQITASWGERPVPAQVAASVSTQVSRSPTPRSAARISLSGCRFVSTPTAVRSGRASSSSSSHPPAPQPRSTTRPDAGGSSRASSRRTIGTATGAAMGWSVWARRLISARSMAPILAGDRTATHTAHPPNG